MADAQFQFGAGFDCLRCASGAEGQRSVVDVPQVRLPSSPAAANYSCAKCTKPSLSLLEMAKLRSEVRDAVKQSKALREAAKQDLKSGKVAAAVGRYAGAIGVCKAAILKTQAMGAGKAAHGGLNHELITCMSNQALMHLKREDFVPARDTCDEALEFEIKDETIHQKILFRRGKALRGLGDFPAVALCMAVHSSDSDSDSDDDPAPPPQAPPSFLAEIAELEVLCKSHDATAATAQGGDVVAARAPAAVAVAVAEAQDTGQPTDQGATESPAPTSSQIRETVLEARGGDIVVEIELVCAGTTTASAAWDAGLVLAHYLSFAASKQSLCLADKRVMEIGAGTGFVGICAAILGADVTLTDCAQVLPKIEANIVLNKAALEDSPGSCQTQALAWGDEKEMAVLAQAEPFDYVLLSDCVFEEEHIASLVATLAGMASIGPSTTVIMANERRTSQSSYVNAERSFQHAIRQHFAAKPVAHADLHPDFRSNDIGVVSMCRIDASSQPVS